MNFDEYSKRIHLELALPPCSSPPTEGGEERVYHAFTEEQKWNQAPYPPPLPPLPPRIPPTPR